MGVLQVREYGRIRRATQFSPVDATVTAQQLGALEAIADRYRATRRVSILQRGPGQSLIAQNFVGIIKLGEHQVEILPKIDCPAAQVRLSLSRMLAETLDLPLHAGEQAAVGRVDAPLLDVMIRLFCQQLWTAVRRGIIRRYETHEENINVLRGRLNVGQQLRRNVGRPDKLHCSFDEFTPDHAMNRALKAALRVLVKVATEGSSTRSVSELLFCFQDVTDVAPTAVDWTRISTDRLSKQYAPLLRMAKLFLEGASPDVISGSDDGFSLLFDMNELFESYIGQVAKRVLVRHGYRVRLQGPVKHLARTQAQSSAFELRPDIVVYDHDGKVLVLDTKWKRLDIEASREAVSQSDLYQMFAYAHRYDAREVVLVYPHHSGLGVRTTRRASYHIDWPVPRYVGSSKKISVSSIDLSDLNEVPEQILNLVQG